MTVNLRGIKTSEFSLTIVVVICATVALALGDINSNVWASVLGGTSGLYSLSRGLAKVTLPPPGAVSADVPVGDVPVNPLDQSAL